MVEQLLQGSWPVRMHADRFFGTVQADGQRPRIAALACHNGDVIAMSLVGYDASVSAVLAKLWLRESVPVQIAQGVKWDGPRHLKRRPEAYKQLSTQLEGTKEVQCLALPAPTHIAEGILHPPDLPDPPKEPAKNAGAAEKRRATEQPAQPETKIDRTRFVLGNWDEEYPNERSFLGTLYGMRILFLHRDEDHPEWPRMWASELWVRGSARKLIQPLRQTLGCKAWVLSDNLVAWGKLVGDGAREGWLPWADRTTVGRVPASLGAGSELEALAVQDALALAGFSR